MEGETDGVVVDGANEIGASEGPEVGASVGDKEGAEVGETVFRREVRVAISWISDCTIAFEDKLTADQLA